MYKIGPLFPHDRNGKPNIVISSSFEMREEPGGSYSVYPANNNEKNGKLKTSLSITTEPINVPGIDVFMNEWLIPQLSIKQNDNTYFVQPSIYSQYRNKANGYITGGGSRFANLYDAVRVGYIGEGSEDYTLDDDFWQGKPDADNQRDKRIAAALKDESNWKPDEYWGAYQGGTMVKSKYEGDSLRTILPNYNGDDAKRVWTPSLLYTYKRSGQKATMPGPVLMVNPGDNVKIKFKNNIEIPGLTTKDLIATSVVSNSSLGSGGSNGHGGSTTTNFHGHGLHVNSVGFGDNVVSRYTTGQKWTTNFDIENYHNMGSYWFHPHYHPSVNQQVYGGLSGNMQVGDPLSRVPHFSDVPRNIATIKQNAFSVDKNTGELQLDNYQNAPWGNMVAASTVNGEFNPTVKSEGGWQSLSLSNQANQALYNISLHHTGPDGNRSVLPVFIYGEDGHQYPKIRRAKGVLGQLVDKERRNQSGADYDDGYNACASDGGPGIPLPIKYPHKKKMENMNFQDFVSMPPGKRVDILFYLPEGETEITSLYTIHTDHEEYNLYSVNNMGLYPNLTSNNRDWFLGNNGCKLTPSASVGGVETGSGSGQGTGIGSASIGVGGRGGGGGNAGNVQSTVIGNLLTTAKDSDATSSDVDLNQGSAGLIAQSVGGGGGNGGFNISGEVSVGLSSGSGTGTVSVGVGGSGGAGGDALKVTNSLTGDVSTSTSNGVGVLAQSVGGGGGNGGFNVSGGISASQSGSGNLGIGVGGSGGEGGNSGSISNTFDPTVIAVDNTVVGNVITTGADDAAGIVAQSLSGGGGNGGFNVNGAFNISKEDAGNLGVGIGGFGSDGGFASKVLNRVDGGGGKRNELRRPGPGQLATFVVENGKPSLSEQELKQEIKDANRSISVQNINPLLDGDQYDPEKKVPSINLYETNTEGEDKWKPVRRREFNWAARVLVGPEREWDAYTQSMVEKYKNMDPPVNIQSHKTSLTSLGEPWGGYDQPFLINDHVFPSGPLTIAQLGTLEEWTLWNWSVLSGQKYVGHPFHIHINDYQVKNSDTELPNKRNLEDTTILNSTGWHYKDWKQKEGDQYIVRKSEPFRGDFEKVDGATTLPANKLKTWGRNSMDIRMMFQDYVGTYVYHCHILPHEDQGMMQVVTVVENTDSSWLLPVEGLQTETLLNDSPILRVYKAQDYEQRSINLDVIGGDLVQRSSVGDINNDDIQDIALSIHSDDSAPGRVVIIDGAGLRDRDETNVIATIAPYEDGLAPWVFVEDFSGDGKRDLITAGFSKKQSGDIDLNDLRIKMFLPRNRQKMQTAWNQKFEINPFEHISLTESYGTDDSGMDHSDMDHSDSSKSHSLAPVQDLKSEQVSVMMADMNLDNFNDFIVAYVIEDGLRIIALDGAAAALHFETGKKEGGYRPDKEILAQSVLSDVKLGDIDQVVLTSGFNNYYQAPLENLLVNIQAKGKSHQYTIQLNAGHFIATSEPEQGDHGSHGMSKPVDARLINLSPGSYMPMNLTNVLRLPKNHIAPTPTVTGARGNGALLMNGQIAFAQGNDVNGNSSTSKKIYNTAQQTLVSLAGLRKVDDDDLTGIVGTTLNDKFSARDIDERNNLSGMAVLAYTGDFAKPGDLANLSSGVLGQGGAVYEIADEITASGSSGMEDDVVAYFGNSLDKLNTGKIVKKTVRTLAGRKASREEINQWSKEVDEGLSKKHLPLSVLLELSGEDLNRVALSSAASKWFLAQWATSANVNGSFSQGFSANAEEFIQMGSTIKSSGSFASLPEAQQVFNSFLDESLSDMVGTPVAKRGMF